ncbi:MAG: hypothetical protein JRC93_10455 [Deltaproteobacteria bacterium]|nr:hypothetical protein [Deltaproteobacteria bacterium]
MIKSLENIAARFEPKIRDSLLRAFASMKSHYTIAEIETALTSRGIGAVLIMIDEMPIEEILQKEVIGDINEAIISSGRQTVHIVPPLSLTDKTIFYYNILNPVTTDYIRTYNLNLVHKISVNTRDAIKNAIRNDHIAGNNPRSTARVFRDTVGLTPRQEMAIRNYEKGLTELDSTILSRELRDKKYDATIRQAISNKSSLSKTQINEMVDSYRSRYITFRAETIARTESLRAVSIGEYTSVIQGVNAGTIDPILVRRFWIYKDDKRTRNEHRKIPSLNPGGVRVDQPFQTPLGPILFPRDPAGSAANTIQCRCIVVYRLIDRET